MGFCFFFSPFAQRKPIHKDALPTTRYISLSPFCLSHVHSQSMQIRCTCADMHPLAVIDFRGFRGGCSSHSFSRTVLCYRGSGFCRRWRAVRDRRTTRDCTQCTKWGCTPKHSPLLRTCTSYQRVAVSLTLNSHTAAESANDTFNRTRYRIDHSRRTESRSRTCQSCPSPAVVVDRRAGY